MCYGPLTTSWIRVGWNFKPLRSQVTRKNVLSDINSLHICLDLLLQCLLWRFNYLWIFRRFSAFQSIHTFSTLFMAKKNTVSVNWIDDYSKKIPVIDIHLVMRVVRQITMEVLIGIIAVSIMNFILQVLALDTNHPSSVRKQQCISFLLIDFSVYSHRHRWSTYQYNW